MNKTHIRSYAVTGAGDLVVNAYQNGSCTDISGSYAGHEHPTRKDVRLDAHLDIYRYDDGHLAWNGSPNGHDVHSALTYQFLLGLFLEDIEQEAGAQRAF